MINALLTAIYDRLRADAELSGLLAVSAIDGIGSAVYTGIPVPPSAALPYVVITGPISDNPDDTLEGNEYRRVLLDLHCYAARPDSGGGSVVMVNSIAQRVRALVHRQPLTLPGDLRQLVVAVENVISNDDTAAYGRVLLLRSLVAA